MALDRSWYDTLVDDDGSNTVGTVWGKDDVNALMGATDAELLRLNGGPVRFYPNVTSDNATGYSIGGNSSYYTTMGPWVFFRLYLLSVNVTTSTTLLRIGMPPLAVLADAEDRVGVLLQFAATYQSGWMMARAAGYWEVFRMGGGFTPDPAVHIMVQGFYLKA